jgi:hypothetical protein
MNKSRKFVITVLSFLISLLSSVNAQQSEKKETILRIGKLKDFIYKGYEINLLDKGNLNLDEFSDRTLLLEKKDFNSIKDDRPNWILLLLLGKGNNFYQLAARNDSLFDDLTFNSDCKPCQNVNDTIKIDNGKLKITLSLGGSSAAVLSEYTFNYSVDKKDWNLIGIMRQESDYEFNDEDQVIGIFTSKKRYYTIKDFGKKSIKDFSNYY